MKIGIMADSHDHMDYLQKAVELFNKEKVDHVLHAGDYVAPFTKRIIDKLNMPFQGVLGNNDGEILGLKSAFGDITVAPRHLEIDGKKFCILHEPYNLEAIEKSGLFDYIIYGHIHKVDIREGPSTVINPGEVGGWLSGKATVVILDTSTGRIDLREL